MAEQELIKIDERNGLQAVSARELHSKLGYDKSHWSRWYEKNIVKNTFAEEGIDYETFAIVANGNETKDFALSIDFAKELCMLARNENGKMIRKYFIEREKISRNLPALPQNFSEALRMLADKVEQNEEQQKVITEQTKVISDMTNTITDMQQRLSYTDQILASKSTMTVTGIAQDYGMSAKAFNAILHNAGIQHKVDGQWVLYAPYLKGGYVQSKTITFQRKDGTQGTTLNTEWTQKGRLFLYQELKKRDVLPVIEQPVI